MNKTINVGNRTFQLRAMTFAEVKKLRADKDGMPVEQPAVWVLGENTLDDLPYPEVRQIADQVYDLTFGSKDAEGNS